MSDKKQKLIIRNERLNMGLPLRPLDLDLDIKQDKLTEQILDVIDRDRNILMNSNIKNIIINI